jgi:hypothetical protein
MSFGNNRDHGCRRLRSEATGSHRLMPKLFTGLVVFSGVCCILMASSLYSASSER